MSQVELAQLRSSKSLPGVYSMNESVQNSRITIVSLYQATLACRRQPDAPAQSQRVSFDRNQKFNFMGSCALPYYDRQTGRVEHGISCAGCQLAIEMDIIDTEWGYEARDKVYAQDGYLDHFRWCEQAQLLWTSSGEGKNPPPELPIDLSIDIPETVKHVSKDTASDISPQSVKVRNILQILTIRQIQESSRVKVPSLETTLHLRLDAITFLVLPAKE